MYKKLKNILRHIFIELVYKRYIIINSLTSLGDIFLMGIHLKALKRTYGKKVLILHNRDYPDDIYKKFNSIDVLKTTNSYFFWDMLDPNNLEKYRIDNKVPPQTGKIYQFHLSKRPYTPVNNYIEHFYANAFWHLDNNEPDIPNLIDDKQIYDNVTKEFEKLVVVGRYAEKRTVLILPYSVTFNYKKIPVDFWKELALGFIQKGYQVVINAKENDETYKEFKKVFMPVPEQIVFAQRCFSSIGVRSGLIDIFGFYNVPNLMVIYPPELKENGNEPDYKKMYFEIIKGINEENYIETKLKWYSISNGLKNDKIGDYMYTNNKETINKIYKKISSNTLTATVQ